MSTPMKRAAISNMPSDSSGMKTNMTFFSWAGGRPWMVSSTPWTRRQTQIIGFSFFLQLWSYLISSIVQKQNSKSTNQEVLPCQDLTTRQLLGSVVNTFVYQNLPDPAILGECWSGCGFNADPDPRPAGLRIRGIFVRIRILQIRILKTDPDADPDPDPGSGSYL